MYYSDHLALAEKEITSRNLCCLVDTAVMLYEEELLRKGKSKCHTKTKSTLSAKEEESDKRIFHLFPRKTRTSVFTRRNSQQNLNVASSSSSFLLDLTTIPADLKTRNPQNPNGASSSSSSFLENYKIMAESKKKTEIRNQRNPNSQSSLSSCLTENKSRKRPATQDTKRCGKSMKAKVETFSWKERETPEWLTLLMNDTNEAVLKWGERTDLRLIFEKTLFKTDVNPGESRLSMPFNELIRKDFLTPVELRIIEEDINSDKKMGIGAILVDQRNVKWGVMLKRWEMKKDSGRGSWNYALTCGWNDIVKANGLKQGDIISVWSFRWGGLLCFALVTPPPSIGLSL
ncbi:hypothetical protein EUTSA_v10029471mg [Eutrema salsugineum]|uniref:TF-B3 domain-containing protein n=1 Tax=Eutrema salsugineum TaxID=72664 RepID=V4KKK3_EUTSA|nr:B3 domain-containing protein At3g25182 [Eutrema salsugineum]ESQ38405.1 hypothetical protein EUTSA_v10029471mg [Eutrema salsugineum]